MIRENFLYLLIFISLYMLFLIIEMKIHSTADVKNTDSQENRF